jgi:hypothetical protein
MGTLVDLFLAAGQVRPRTGDRLRPGPSEPGPQVPAEGAGLAAECALLKLAAAIRERARTPEPQPWDVGV